MAILTIDDMFDEIVEQPKVTILDSGKEVPIEDVEIVSEGSW